MEKQVKDLSVYKNKFEDDIMSFREFEALDYVRELKNQGNLDEAIEVGRTFLSTRPDLKTYINHYGYALYNKYIKQDENKVIENEKLYFDIVKEILDITKQERYSPYETVVNNVIKFANSKNPVDYAAINQHLDLLNPVLLSKEPFISSNKKEGESHFERWYRLKVRSLFETEDYKGCVSFANQALAQPIKWHYRNMQWICYYRALSNLKLGNYEESETDFLSLQGQMNSIDFYRALYDLHSNLGHHREANTYLIYDLFISGYKTNLLPLYESLLKATKQVEDQQLEKAVCAFIHKIKEETSQPTNDDEIDEKYKELNSSDLYDKVMILLVQNLSKYIDRVSGKVIHYNNEKQLGSIVVNNQKETLFFRQSDFIYDEEIRKFDRVEFSVMKAYDTKKGAPTTKAILLLLSDDFDDYYGGY